MTTITATAVPGTAIEPPDRWSRDAYAWTVTLCHEGRTMACPYWTGSPKAPTADRVVHGITCLAWSASRPFGEWCASKGIVPTPRAVHRYDEARAMGEELSRLLGRPWTEVYNPERFVPARTRDGSVIFPVVAVDEP